MLHCDEQEPLQVKILETMPVEVEAIEHDGRDQNNRELQNYRPESSNPNLSEPGKKETAHSSTGTIQSDKKSFMRVACHDGWLEVCSLQPAGRKRMAAADFIRGFKGDINNCYMK
jgi:methionyl-tRNA formyltransferase